MTSERFVLISYKIAAWSLCLMGSVRHFIADVRIETFGRVWLFSRSCLQVGEARSRISSLYLLGPDIAVGFRRTSDYCLGIMLAIRRFFCFAPKYKMDIDIVTVNLHRPRKITGKIVHYQRGYEDSDESDEVPIQQCVSDLRSGFGCENSTTKPRHFDDFVTLEHGRSLKRT